ncbi:hypothetical protein LTR37_017416 [Vermiconidia calcicola]|uniref:Uncharacterized protein n=1 Tax=Vermiconidia calcicola TaxID=1690605 RepID=A0ACC3MLJ7_9PEZI|nr:hypothetical protein LTR37_017416 [Vermiconidia calcicola]
MPRAKFNGLKRPKIRQSWSKYNLYNLTKVSTPPAANKTFFQQKWLAKSLTRGYHHPQVKEKQWTRMFDRRLPAVVSMDYRYLAKYDGSEMALGRGTGQDVRVDEEEGGGRDRKMQKTPYMHMTFHPLERRLDTAIWRALFASSTKQARQFVVHGAVKVNGKKMAYPGYQLNPGDMFSVDPDKVLYATGRKKRSKDSPISKQDELEERRERKAAAKDARQEEDEAEAESDAGAATLESDEEREAMTMQPEDHDDPKKALKSLVTRAQRILDDSKRKLSGKRQAELRDFTRSIKKTMSKLRSIEESQVEDTIEGLETGLAEILTKIPHEDLPRDVALDTIEAAEQRDQETAVAAEPQSSNPQMKDPNKVDHYRARKDAELLHAALERARENPIDASKPYATPWKPRDFMSAFAFIPRYLEVNHNICSAVYLRHPVARPGLAEVPTPFHGETLGLAFNWYLRRR